MFLMIFLVFTISLVQSWKKNHANAQLVVVSSFLHTRDAGCWDLNHHVADGIGEDGQ